MYYKVIKDNRVIDVLDRLIYLKYQPEHNIMILSDENEAQAILSSDNDTIWHEVTLYNIPTDKLQFDTVEIVEIDKYEYKQLKILNLTTPEAIIDEFLLSLIDEGVV